MEEPKVLIITKIKPDPELDVVVTEELPDSPTSENIKSNLSRYLQCDESTPFVKLPFTDSMDAFMFGGRLLKKELYYHRIRDIKKDTNSASICIVNIDTLETSSMYQMSKFENEIKNFKPSLILFDMNCKSQDIDRNVIATKLDDYATISNNKIKLVLYSFKNKEEEDKEGKTTPIQLDYKSCPTLYCMETTTDISKIVFDYLKEYNLQIENSVVVDTEYLSNDVQQIMEETEQPVMKDPTPDITDKISDIHNRALDILNHESETVKHEEPKITSIATSEDKIGKLDLNIYDSSYRTCITGLTVSKLEEIFKKIDPKVKDTCSIIMKTDEKPVNDYTTYVIEYNESSISIDQRTLISSASDVEMLIGDNTYTKETISATSNKSTGLITFENYDNGLSFSIPNTTDVSVVIQMLKVIGIEFDIKEISR